MPRFPRLFHNDLADYPPLNSAATNRCAEMENAGPSRAPLISDDSSQRYQRGLNTLKDTQRMVR